MLCVEVKALPQSYEVNRQINLEDILLNHTQHFDDVKDAYQKGYTPLDMCTSVRSMYDNTVLSCRGEDHTLYYVNMTNIEDSLHKGVDLLMFMSGVAVLECVEYDPEVDLIMGRHSQFQPIGLYYPPGALINPILYSHIIMSDTGMQLLKPYLKTGVRVCPIKSISYAGNLVALLKTLVTVKEEHHE